MKLKFDLKTRFSIVVIAIYAMYIASSMLSGTKSYYDLGQLKSIPVSSGGRIKPLDTFARTSLVTISGKQTFDHFNKKEPAIIWLLNTMTDPKGARDYRVIRIDHPDVKAILGADVNRKMFSFGEIVEKATEIDDQIEAANKVEPRNRNLYQNKMIELSHKLKVYIDIINVRQPLMVPPGDGVDWTPLANYVDPKTDTKLSAELRKILLAYRDRSTSSFNVSLKNYIYLLKDSGYMFKSELEVIFNKAELFKHSAAMYIIVFLISCVFLLTRKDFIRTNATDVLACAFVLHTVGIILRMYLQERPPVTNLYSSAIFVGWVAILGAFFMEHFYKNGLSVFVSSIVGFITLILAHNLSLTGDTLEMMQAVLDTNFWLATHVVIITMGYSAVFVAGMLAIVYILKRSFGDVYQKEAKEYASMIYGTQCFALFASFIGTVLGGIWADQSWGRFWGWDPKENGALIIVLWCALILHARWGGLIKIRGMAMLSVIGNIVVAWSWFGTNMLGVGLHSYGFINSAAMWLLIFVAFNMLVFFTAYLLKDDYDKEYQKNEK